MESVAGSNAAEINWAGNQRYSAARLLRHGDRVTIANQAQLVNVIAPIRSEAGGPAWRQASFWPFARMSALAKGQIMQLAVDSGKTSTAKFGDVDAVDATATWDEQAGRLALFLANRSMEEGIEVSVDLRGLSSSGVRSAEVLTIPEGGDRNSANVLDAQDTVGLKTLQEVGIEDGVLYVKLPALSWSVLELDVERA